MEQEICIDRKNAMREYVRKEGQKEITKQDMEKEICIERQNAMNKIHQERRTEGQKCIRNGKGNAYRKEK